MENDDENSQYSVVSVGLEFLVQFLLDPVDFVFARYYFEKFWTRSEEIKVGNFWINA